MASFRGETSYGFRPEIIEADNTDLQPCFRNSHIVAHLASQMPGFNLSRFPDLATSAGDGSDSTDRLDEVCSPPLDMSSALSSDVFIRMWDRKTRSLHFSASGPQEDHLSDNHDWEDPADEEVPNVIFQTKYFDFFPLYQNYFLLTVRNEVHKLKDNVSELIKPQSLDCLRGVKRSESEPVKSHNFEGLRSPLSIHGRFEVTSLNSSPETTLPSTPSRSKVTFCTLWQDLEEVKTSDLLRILTPKEIRLQETMFELMGSEASYLKSLGVLVNHFYASKALKKTLSTVEHGIVFSNVCQVIAVSARFLMDLETRLEESLLISQVGDIVLRHCKAFRQNYTTYVTNAPYQKSLVNQLLEQNQDFVYVLKKLESDPVCQRQSFKSFLVLPFQRITRIKLLLETILKLTEPASEAVSNLEKAICVLHEILISCDKKTQKMKQIEELICLEMLMDFNDVKSVPLVISTRFQIRQGPVKQLLMEGTYGQRMSFNKVYLHLFNDLLIISTKKYQRFMVADHARFPEHVTVDHLKTDALGLPPDSFLLHLSQSQRGPPTALILVALSKSDKEEWMKAFSSE
ncbi:ephexin-1 [Kryptolebias marmoratus]|uniref:Si:ch73-15b2.5 n=1 Tax=Kryptolebias marmoratus TaxID=37003 RepID=A0A3Q3F3C4_KRYMA|nr:ephexin-1 [Kryptolebias marmoratus]